MTGTEITVAEITDISKTRVKIKLDNGFAFVLYKGELRIYGIEQGQELEAEVYREILEELLPKRARLRALNLLKSRDYTKRQLQDKLHEGGYPETIIQDAIAYVASFGYLDDARYARDFIEYHKTSRSKGRIMQDLRQRGIPDELLQQCWEEMAGDKAAELEQEQILSLARKRHFCPQTASFEEKQRLMAFLYRKGFSAEAIRNALSLDIMSEYV